MIRRCFSLTLFALVFAPGFLRAQQEPAEGKTRIFFEVFVEPKYDKMYEDIEILRRILDRKLQPLYQRVQRATAKPVYAELSSATLPHFDSLYRSVLPNTAYNYMLPLPQPPQVYPTIDLVVPNPSVFNAQLPNSLATLTTEEVGFSSLEGVYLKGQGIVYTATLTSLQPLAKTESAKKSVSEWESVRRQVRNEKETPKKPEASKPPLLSDVLLKVLAENGHHFAQLGENESLTIILTVHDANAPSPPAKSEKGSAKTESQSADKAVIPGLRAEVRDSELLGELHLKQGKHEEAMKAFHYVLKRISDPKREAELHRKLAQCYLMQGQDEKARAELDQAITLMKKVMQAKVNPAPPSKPSPALPSKLIISAPKKLLDQVKEGKITFEEFRRQAHVETLRFDDRR